MIRFAPLIALTLLAACGSGDGGNVTAPANSVAAVQAPAGQDWTQTVSKTPEGGYRMGNPNASLKLIEYGSRTCPTCGAFGQQGMRPLEENYVRAGKVSYEFRDFPVHGAIDVAATLLGRCAGPQPFFPILEQMYIDQPQTLDKQMAAAKDAGFVAQFERSNPKQQAALWAQQVGYLDFVKQRGVTDAQARACLADEKAMEAIAAEFQAASTRDNVTGTPTFILNGQKLDAASWAQVEQALKAAGA